MNSDKVENLLQQGMLQFNAGNLPAAKRAFEKVLRIDNRHFGALNLMAAALMRTQHFAGAEIYVKRAHAINPQNVTTVYNFALVLHQLGKNAEAATLLDQAVALNANDAEIWNNRGLVLAALKRFEEAVASYDRAVSLRPNYADAHYNRGNALKQLGRSEDSLASYAAALRHNPDHLDAHRNRAGLLWDLGRHEDAAAAYEPILRLAPADSVALLHSLHSHMQICSWKHYQSALAAITQALAAEPQPVSQIALLALPCEPRVARRSAERLVREFYPKTSAAGGSQRKYGHARPRIGYFSSDFRRHAMASLFSELFERHDKERFDFFAFAFAPKAQDDARTRIAATFGDRFHEVADESDEAVAASVRRLEIDIAIDLNGLTAGRRTSIFAMRPAPIQINYLGFPGTVGADYIDYIVASPILIPPEQTDGYTEKVISLPHTYQPNDTKRPVADVAPSRAELGLPEQGFVFCNFNNNFKITPDVFDIWMRLVANTPASVLWLLEDNPAARRNLCAEAQNRGIAAERLVFAPRANMPDHLARQRRADLFLDTLYYNAHTTASDALWVGLPLLTCPGKTFASRVAANLVTAAGLPELVTGSLAEYEAVARDLAAHPQKLADIRQKLARNRLTCPLFDIERYTRHIEDAYEQVWRRHEQGLPPDHVTIAP